MKSKFLPHTKENLEKNYRIGMEGFYGTSEVDAVKVLAEYMSKVRELNIISSKLPRKYSKKPFYKKEWFRLAILGTGLLLGTLSNILYHIYK